MEDYSSFLSAYEHMKSALGHDKDSKKPVPIEFVVWAYRLFLDREPEDIKVAEQLRSSVFNSKQLREMFVASEEFRVKSGTGTLTPSTKVQAGYLEIERINDRKALQSFFDHVKLTWTKLGETEPHWSVLSAEQFKQENLSANLESFRESGAREIERLFELLERNGISVSSSSTCIEYGCGVGRVTRALAARFSQVIGCDISSSHIGLAKNYLNETGCKNVNFKLIGDLKDIENLPKVDFFYSVIVLQHNPPPIIEVIVTQLAKSLKPGGYGFFQVPTYREGYSFAVKEYLAALTNPNATKNIEMHLLPKRRAFELISSAGCVVVDDIEDDWAGQGYQSFSFLIHRRDV